MEYLLLTKIYKLLFCIFIYFILKDINFNRILNLFLNKEERGE